MMAMMGPLLGSVPLKVSSSPSPCPGDPISEGENDAEAHEDLGTVRDQRTEADHDGGHGQEGP